ncbi:hypothetical protein GQ54DRAFT_38058 [Martensiomyces pterosporus]|nr:hypothetical protein GQ54DRAFT_38058 [Martensiomyces pterosporus]
MLHVARGPLICGPPRRGKWVACLPLATCDLMRREWGSENSCPQASDSTLPPISKRGFLLLGSSPLACVISTCWLSFIPFSALLH